MVNRAIKARDLCATCYDRLWSNGSLPRKVTVAQRVLDVLEADGGWLTTDAVVHALPNCSYGSVHKALFRLRGQALVESRPGAPLAGGMFAQNEWRLA